MAFQQGLSKLRASFLTRKNSDHYNLNKQRQKIMHVYRSDNVDETGNNALHLAAMEGNYECVKFFCLNYANVALPNNDGNDALMLAVIHKHNKIVKYLLSVGAHTYTRNKEGNTAYELVDKNTQKSVEALILLNRSNAKSRNYLSTQSLTQEAAVETPNADISDSVENKKRWISVKIDETKLENDTDKENGTSFKRESSKRFSSCEIVRTMYIKSKNNEVYKQETYKKCVDLNQENCQDGRFVPSLPNVFKEHSDTVNKYEKCHDQIEQSDLVEQTTQSVTITQTTLLDTATQSSQTETMSQSTQRDVKTQSTQNDVMAQSTQTDAMSHSTNSDAMSQTTKSETMSQSIQCEAMSQSTQAEIMSRSTETDTMSQSTQTDEKSQSTQTKAMSQSTLRDGMPHSSQTDTISQSTQSDYIAQCTQTDAISKFTKTDVMSQSTQTDTMLQSTQRDSMAQSTQTKAMSQSAQSDDVSQSTQSDSLAQCAQTDTSHNTIIQSDQSEFYRRSAKDDINLNQSQSNRTTITIKDNAATDQNNENKITFFLNEPGNFSVQLKLADQNSFQETASKKFDGVKRTLSFPAKVSPPKEFQSVEQNVAEKQACSLDQNHVKLKKSISCPSINLIFNTVNITGNDSKTAIDGTLNINKETCDSQL
ncbi:hypothetical protein Bpfe_015523 [Biomphalaria pfeifferi]|uniref:Uncharacterized protein n=1 Tax=Biomphalaria pfeifferi TaxID=112525 RepID=A0AAD8F7W8_BIOPF|nr:hypothetical protein Bpfe_015523 [Biomphalaria pfeifferi]